MSNVLIQRCYELIKEIQLDTGDSITNVTALTGGVSSDIARIELGTRRLCVKFALPKLKVTANWHAPVRRNAAEYAWLQLAASIAPESAVTLYGRSARLHGFAMEFIEGEGVYLWKTALLATRNIGDEAGKVGKLMARIHAASARSDFNPAPFQNRDDFYSLRIEPYLVYTASRHPNLTRPLAALADHLYKSNQILIHGDISPKNILFKDDTPIILDAECATLGDASFDLAFCLNHLVLKAIHLPNSCQQLLNSALRLWQEYQPHVDWEAVNELETRVCQLLPALMLARVDGKSPVEYLSALNQTRVRAIAIALIEAPCQSLPELCTLIQTKLALTESNAP